MTKSEILKRVALLDELKEELETMLNKYRAHSASIATEIPKLLQYCEAEYSLFSGEYGKICIKEAINKVKAFPV